MKNKLDPKSLVCVFIGYNEKYKGYRCLYPPTGRVYISRHVLFDESVFPFADMYSQFHRPTDSVLLMAWRDAHLKQPETTSPDDIPEEVPPPQRSSVIHVGSIPVVIPPLSPHSPADQGHFSPDTTSENSSNHSVEDLPEEVIPLHQPAAPHAMTTRARAGIVKPNPRYALFTVKSDHTEPKSLKAALRDPLWTGAMSVEMGNMHETDTWDLVPPCADQNPLSCGWVHKIKLNADGSVDKHKSRLVARGNEQEEGTDYLETFSPVVRTATIRTVLHVAVTKHWNITQLDVQSAFLHGDLKETVYMKQPPGFEDPETPDYVCKLKKAIYGLKQAPRAWFDKFSMFLLDFGFACSFSDPSLFIYHRGSDVIYLLLYVDDMIVTGNNEALIKSLLTSLNTKFRMKNMGEAHYFLGIQIHRSPERLFMNQEKYAQDLLITAGMADCSPMSTPLPLKLDNVSGQDELFSDPSYFRSLAGKLQYLTITRPDLQFSVNYICQRMHMPTQADFSLLKRILRYIKGTYNMGINITAGADSTLLCYSDSDWAGCKSTRCSTGGLCTLLGSNVISWSAKRHDTVSKSSTEAEYRTMSIAASEIVWLQNLLRDMGLQQQRTPLLLCDNLSAVCLTANPMFHKRTKHFDVDYRYVRERVALKALEVKHIPATLQLADIFTKSLSQAPFFKLRDKLGVSVPSTPSLRGCIETSGPSSNVEPTAKPNSSTVSAKAFNVQRSCKMSAASTTIPAHSPATFNRFDCLIQSPIMC